MAAHRVMNAPYRLMAPGPVPLPKDVLQCLALPMIHHRTPEFSAELTFVLKELKTAFATSQPVFLITSTGSGAMEAALVNTLSPGDEVLGIESGKFSRRWIQIAKAHNLQTHIVKTKEGHPISPRAIDETLKKNPKTKAVMIQACETSTGTQNPVFAISQVVQTHPKTLLIVDAMTAIGAMEFKMDDWNVDVVVASSQKAFMLPTGLSFVSFSQRAWDFHQTAQCPRFYFDLKAEFEANEKGQTRFSSSVSHIRALKLVLQKLNQDPMRGPQRCQALARATRCAVKKLGLQVFSKTPSSSVTSITVPAGFDGERIKRHLFEEFKISIAGGQGQLTGKILRIGHLGFIRDEDLVETIQGLGHSLLAVGWAVSQTQINEAVQAACEQLKGTS